MNSAFDSCSDKSNQPKKIPIIGVKKEKLATVVAEYRLKSQTQNIKPIEANKTWKEKPA